MANPDVPEKPEFIPKERRLSNVDEKQNQVEVPSPLMVALAALGLSPKQNLSTIKVGSPKVVSPSFRIRAQSFTEKPPSFSLDSIQESYLWECELADKEETD